MLAAGAASRMSLLPASSATVSRLKNSPTPVATRWGLAALSLAALLSSLGTSIANVALPTLTEQFHAPFQTVQWVVIAYLLAVTSLIVGAGRLGDVIGKRRLLTAGLGVFAAGSTLCGSVPTLEMLIIGRMVQGIGAATMMALSMAMVAETVPAEKVGRGMGLLGMMSAIGTALGPSLGGFLIASLDWRSLFLIQVPVALVAVFLSRNHLPPDRPPATTASNRFDFVGTAVLAATLGAYSLGLTMGRGHFGPVNVGLLIGALGGGWWFVRIQLSAPAPLVRPAIFRDPTLTASLSMSMLVAMVVMATLVIGPFHLARALGLDAAEVGLAMSLGPLAAALMGIPAGKVVDRFGAQSAAKMGLAGMGSGTALLAVGSEACGVGGYVLPLMITTGSYAVFQTANNLVALQKAAPSDRGLISGVLNLSRNLGLISGTTLMGAVFAHAVPGGDLAKATPEAIAEGTRTSFGWATGLLVVALAIAQVRRRREERWSRATL